ncbi:hypothetical protein [Desulfosarcina variabilis]|uniref:hypothetical protein n=1 Tax=Desulfosarcina variabilis TaxID=2300 RepID=UPI003AFA70A3
MTASASLVLANHRPETIPLARRLMAVHDTILLEEPPEKGFEPMLDGKINIDAYLENQELEYPDCEVQRIYAVWFEHFPVLQSPLEFIVRIDATSS